MNIAHTAASINVDWAATIDWKNPYYGDIYAERERRLIRLRDDPDLLPGLRDYYKYHPADFINDWGMTFDPRNADIDKPTVVPFILTPKQREWIDWVMSRWESRQRGLCEKARDMGVTWLAGALSGTLCLFRQGVVVGFGSRKAEYVDEIGTMKPILPKIRFFIEHVPKEFRGEWEAWRDAPKMRINFPSTGSYITGEAGDSIGRGDRASIYFVDEAAHLPRPQLVEASLSQTTRCRIDLSSVNGMNNPFAQNRWKWNDERVFIFDWRDDPRKDEEWYRQQQDDLDPVVVAQEIDRDYAASITGVVLPGDWVRSCIGAAEKLGIEVTGEEWAALDVADEGVDKNCWVGAKGIEVRHIVEWSGRGSDIFATAQRSVDLCDEHGYRRFRYDEDGLGAGVRGDMRQINTKRQEVGARTMPAEGWRGSAAVVNPEGIVEGTRGIDGMDKGRKNKDYFKNRKAQGWWALRKRVEKTHRCVTRGIKCDPDDILSIDPKLPNLWKLVAELSQPTYDASSGKIVIDKKPDGMPSPNMADGVMMRYAPGDPHVIVTPDLMKRVAAMAPRRRY